MCQKKRIFKGKKNEKFKSVNFVEEGKTILRMSIFIVLIIVYFSLGAKIGN